MAGCTDGTFIATGEKHFTCAHGKGLYFPLATLRPDERFGLQAGHAASSLGNRECALKVWYMYTRVLIYFKAFRFVFYSYTGPNIGVNTSVTVSLFLQLFKLRWKNKQTRLSMILISR